MTSKPSRLPSSVFADSPLRATLKKVELTASPGALESSPSESLEVLTPAPIVRATPSPLAKKKLEQSQRKLTLYADESDAVALEAEVFRRRSAGNLIRTSDLLREIVREWALAQAAAATSL